MNVGFGSTYFTGVSADGGSGSANGSGTSYRLIIMLCVVIVYISLVQCHCYVVLTSELDAGVVSAGTNTKARMKGSTDGSTAKRTSGSSVRFYITYSTPS